VLLAPTLLAPTPCASVTVPVTWSLLRYRVNPNMFTIEKGVVNPTREKGMFEDQKGVVACEKRAWLRCVCMYVCVCVCVGGYQKGVVACEKRAWLRCVCVCMCVCVCWWVTDRVNPQLVCLSVASNGALYMLYTWWYVNPSLVPPCYPAPAGLSRPAQLITYYILSIYMLVYIHIYICMYRCIYTHIHI